MFGFDSIFGCEAPLVFLSHELSGAVEDHHQLVRLAGLPAGVTKELLRIGIRMQREYGERERLRPGTHPATFRGEGGSLVGLVRLGLLQGHQYLYRWRQHWRSPRMESSGRLSWS